MGKVYQFKAADSPRMALGIYAEHGEDGRPTGMLLVVGAYVVGSHVRLDRQRYDAWSDVEEALRRDATTTEQTGKRARHQPDRLNMLPAPPKVSIDYY